MVEHRIRALITKVGLDSHDRGAMIVATALRNAGTEVIYLGRYHTPVSIVKTALQEDVDIIGVSCHCGEHLNLIPKILDILRENKMEHIPLILGGVIPREDIPGLKAGGVKEVFLTGSTSDQIVQYIKELARNKRG